MLELGNGDWNFKGDQKASSEDGSTAKTQDHVWSQVPKGPEWRWEQRSRGERNVTAWQRAPLAATGRKDQEGTPAEAGTKVGG